MCFDFLSTCHYQFMYDPDLSPVMVRILLRMDPHLLQRVEQLLPLIVMFISVHVVEGCESQTDICQSSNKDDDDKGIGTDSSGK